MTHAVTAGTRSPGQLRWPLRPGAVLAAFLLACVLLQAALIPAPRGDGLLIGSDGIEYYIHLRSLVIDHDLDFADEYHHYASIFPDRVANAMGRTPNKHAAVGVALLWLPFFVLAHLLVLLASTMGAGLQADGYNYVYQAAICLGSAVYGAWGCWLAYRVASRLYAPVIAFWASVVLWLASNAFYYMVFEPSMPHMLSLFTVSAVLSAWFFKWRDADSMPRWRDALVLGAAAGLVMTVRTQDTLFLLIPAAFIGARLCTMRTAGDVRRLRALLARGALASATTATLFALQLYTWQAIYGVWRQSPMQRDHADAFTWWHTHLLDVAFSTYHGLFTWHPITLVATLGLFLLHQRARKLAWALGAVFLLHLYVMAAWWGWAQGDAFGGRVFLNCYWLWVLGLAPVLAWASVRPLRVAATATLAIVLIAWNALSLVQYRLGFIVAATRPSVYEITVGRLLVPGRVVELVHRHVIGHKQSP